MKQNLHSSVWKCCVLSLLTISSISSFGQYGESASHWEGGITVGPANFLGDLGGNMGKGTTFLKDNNVQMTKLTVGGFLSYHPSQFFGFRLALNFGSLEGDDAIIQGKGGLEEARKIRNSNFRSKISEALLLAEFFPTVFFEYEPSDVFHKLRPYGVAGVGVFKFNPQGTDPFTNEWVDLQPLRTEGQGFAEYPDRQPYKLTQLNVPLGVGVRYYVSESLNVSFEIVHRKTFTDYMDDVSTDYIDPALFYNNLPLAQAQLADRMSNKSGSVFTRVYGPGEKRGTPENNDSYYTAGIKIGLALGNGNRLGNSTRCPIRF